MYYKLWNREQLENIVHKYEDMKDEILTQGDLALMQYFAFGIVIENMQELIGVLDDQYLDRDPDSIGGWLAFFPEPITEQDNCYKDVLNHYHIESSEIADVNEVIVSVEGLLEFVLQIFICSSEFAFVVIYTKIISKTRHSKEKENLYDSNFMDSIFGTNLSGLS